MLITININVLFFKFYDKLLKNKTNTSTCHRYQNATVKSDFHNKTLQSLPILTIMSSYLFSVRYDLNS